MKTIVNFFNHSKKLLFIPLLICLSGLTNTLLAQKFKMGADVMSRYVWRGIDFGNSVSIQPSIEFSYGGFTLGSWASYAISPSNANSEVANAFGASEHDLYVSYNFGPVSIGVTDYYFPNAGLDFFNYENDGAGAHVFEPSISFNGVESFPVILYAAINAYNDPDNSVYLEASIPFSVGETDLGFTVGGSPSEGIYTDSGAGITNINLSLGREIKISDSFSLPLSGSYILNPYSEQSYLVLGISL